MTPAASQSVSAGRSKTVERLGPYRLLEQIGRGGAGVVWRACHEETGRLVALKRVHEGRFHYASSLAREVRALQRIEHPGIVQILDFGRDESGPWYAMELLLGQTLFHGWERENPTRAFPRNQTQRNEPTLELEPRTDHQGGRKPSAVETSRKSVPPAHLHSLLTLIRRLCAPLEFLHGEGLVHRDLKPSNIFIREDGTPVLTDFGLAQDPQDAEGRDHIDDGGGIAGTIGYMSPERIRGESEDPRSDLYSLGCILYEGLTGRTPFWGGSAAEVLDRHLLAVPTRPSHHADGIPEELEELVLKLLAKSPEERPGHASDVAELLASLGGEAWPGAPLPSPRPYLYRPPLAGRESELATLQQVLRRAEDGVSGLVAISGPSGIGKTALVMGLCRLAWHQGWQVVTGECVPVAGYTADTRAAPLHPLTRLLETAVDLCTRDPELIRDLIGPDAGFLIPYEPALARLPDVRPPPDASTLPPETAQERVVRALRDLAIRLSKQRPLLLILDDLQWADTLSLAFLESLRTDDLRTQGVAIAIVCTMRPEEVGPQVQRLLDRTFDAKLVLEPLSQAAISRLVSSMVARPDPPPLLLASAWRHSDGHPLLAAETLRNALARGLLSRDASGQWTIRSGAEATLAGAQPERLTALLEQRLGGLPPGAIKVMQAGALLGRQIHLPLLQALWSGVGSTSDSDLIDGLNELRRRQVLEEQADESFRFVHDRLRELAYQMIPTGERPALHRAAVGAFESRESAGMDLTPALATVAFHALEGGDIRRAVTYSERAGEIAMARGANGEAARLFEQALTLANDHAHPIDVVRRARWERLAAEALEGIGDLERSKLHLKNAGRLLGWPEPSNVGMGFGLMWNLGRQLVRRKLLRPRPVSSAQRLRWEEAALTYEALVRIHYYQSAALPLVYSTFKGLALAERCPDSAVLSSAYSYGYATLNVTPFRTRAGSYLRLAEAALARRPDVAAESYARLLQSVAHFGDGELPGVDRCARQAMDLADKIGFRRRWEEAANALANANHLHGHSDAAFDWSHQVIASARRRGDSQTLTWTLSVRGAAYLDSGLLDEALIDLREAEALAGAVGRNEAIWARGLLSAALLRRGADAEALKMNRQALADLRRSPPVFVGAVDSYAAVASLPLTLLEELQTRGSSDRALMRDAGQAMGCLKAFARVFPIARTRLHLVRARWHLLRGKTKSANRSLDQSLRSAEQMQLVPDQARAHLWLAVGNANSPASRTAHLQSALALFERSSHYHHVEVVRRGLARPDAFKLPMDARI